MDQLYEKKKHDFDVFNSILLDAKCSYFFQLLHKQSSKSEKWCVKN